MSLAPGVKLGPYEIQSPLGAGGMGEVYRARDTRLERSVAVKVLPAHLSASSDVKARFEREARAISALNHPHICTLHDIGQQDGTEFLVMELVEGETLEQRLSKGPLLPEQTVRYGAQIADALAKAHKLGITHRDLKPANIMLTKSGAKLMDFGLAKQSSTAPLAAALTEMTMEQSKLTGEGTIVGTFQYMAPEQLEGKDADGRTDIFALGEVLYEMATGKPAFAGKSRASLIAAILTTEPPPIAHLQPLTPPALERVIRKCLSKDPDDRWQSAGDLASELKWIAEGGSQTGVAAPVSPRRTSREKIAWVVAGAGLCLAAMLGLLAVLHRAAPERLIRSSITSEEGTSLILTGDYSGPPMLSPNGNFVAFVAGPEQGFPLLWVRALDGLHARALPGTENAIFPFWSPDSRALGFFAGGKLRTVSIEGGSPSDICDAPGARGGSWNADGVIVFSPQFQGPIMQVPAAGGTPRTVTVIDSSKHDSHRWPYFLPDGRHFLYAAVTHVNARDPNDGVYFASLDGKENHLVTRTLANPAFAAGRLLYTRDSSLMAQPFDPKTGVLRGEAERVAEDVLADGTIWRAAFDVSGGLLVYASGGLTPYEARWYDRTGKELGTIGEKAFNLLSVRLSPDGTRLATEAGEANSDLWIYDLKRQVNTRLTFGPGASSAPVWSPDGKWVGYTGTRGTNNLYLRAANGTGQEELLMQGDATNRSISDWSPDGKWLLFATGDLASTGRIWLLPLTGDRKPTPLLPESFLSSSGKFSPDGHWIAYMSNESGRLEVYVVPFQGSAGKWQVSSGGGTQPIWRRDGKELFYWSTDNTVLSVPIALKDGAVEIGVARPIMRLNSPIGNVGILSPYDVTADGQRLIFIVASKQAAKPITLVTNWTAGLKQD